jgi:hypothetical protein
MSVNTGSSARFNRHHAYHHLTPSRAVGTRLSGTCLQNSTLCCSMNAVMRGLQGCHHDLLEPRRTHPPHPIFDTLDLLAVCRPLCTPVIQQIFLTVCLPRNRNFLEFAHPVPNPLPTGLSIRFVLQVTVYVPSRHSSFRCVYVSQMNVYAASAGAQNTSYSNPHGMDSYPDPSTHQSTAIDVARIAMKSMQHPQFRDIVQTVKHTSTITRLRRQKHDPLPMTRKDSLDELEDYDGGSLADASRVETTCESCDTSDCHRVKVRRHSQ